MTDLYRTSDDPRDDRELWILSRAFRYPSPHRTSGSASRPGSQRLLSGLAEPT